MATDASRRWLDDSGIWSCRIKIPHSQADHSGASEDVNHLQDDIGADPMDLPLEPNSPVSRRKSKIAEAIHSMAILNNSMEPLDLPTDPDAQATVTDFLDFTEYLPSDMMRALTLIGNLDQTYCKRSAAVNELTTTYGKLPDLPADRKPDPFTLRADISQNLTEAVNARILSHAEACRMADNVDRHYNRAKNILAKLQAMAEAYPASREASPAVPKSKIPTTAVRVAPKITLRLDNSRPSAPEPSVARVRKHRAPRITVPGEVLAPYELDYESYGSESDTWDSDDDEPLTPRHTPGRSLGVNSGRIKLRLPKMSKSKTPKPPRAPRPPGVMGTNVHSAVAGISTSNALAKLKPPPPDAENGSIHKPWLQLTDWELASLRKRMKKNAVWSPSDTMIARELKLLGRGIEAYRAAKEKADATGQPFDQPVPPQLLGHTVDAEGAISVEALGLGDVQLSNRGMKLNEAKKLKKENQAKELAKQAAEEAEESARKVAEAAKAVKSLFDKPPSKDEKANGKKTPAKTPSKTPARKRKRESNADAESEMPAEGEIAVKIEKQEKVERPERPQLKRSKTETPVPAPHPITSKETKRLTPAPATESAPSDASESAPVSTPAGTPVESLPIPAPEPSPKKSSTPILPPGKKETKREAAAKREAARKTETAANSRPRRSSAAATPTPAPEQLPAKRPTSSRSKAASQEPSFPTATATVDRPRRSSTARNTPAPPDSRQPSKRTKRPAPGVVTASSEGSTAVSVGKRSAATRKKAGPKKEKKDGREGSAAQEIFDEVDDEGNIIDPDEPRYCLCNRVSFGTMIGCENENCEKEWFHLECVGLADIPPRTTKWYCPECRIALGIGEKGEVSARGKKK